MIGGAGYSLSVPTAHGGELGFYHSIWDYPFWGGSRSPGVSFQGGDRVFYLFAFV